MRRLVSIEEVFEAMGLDKVTEGGRGHAGTKLWSLPTFRYEEEDPARRCRVCLGAGRGRAEEGRKGRGRSTRKSERPAKRPSNMLRKGTLNLTRQRWSHQAVVWNGNVL